MRKKNVYKKYLEFNAAFNSTCSISIIFNLYSTMYNNNASELMNVFVLVLEVTLIISACDLFR